MKHRDVLPEKWQQRYRELLDNYHDQMNDSLSSLGEDDHPEMHRFDPEGDTNDDLMVELAREGYARFGIHMSKKTSRLQMEIYTNRETIRLHHDVIAYMVAGLDIGEVMLVDITTTYHTRTRQTQFR
jgi:hypothetical protein